MTELLLEFDALSNNRSLAVPQERVIGRHQRADGETAVVFGPVALPSGSATRIRRLHQAGSLKLRFPRLPKPGAEAILVNTSGGLTGGDRLRQRFEVEPDGDLTVTTQACERVYRSLGGDAEVATVLRVGEGATLRYLPQETILFDGGRLRRSLDLEACASSRFLLVESVILGREAMGESVRTGRLRDRWRIRRDGALVFADDLDIDADEAGLVDAPSALGRHRAFATIVWQNGTPEADLPALRAILEDPDGRVTGGASTVARLGVARLAATSFHLLRRRLVPALALLARDGLPLVWSL